MGYPNGRVPASARKQLPGSNAGLLKPHAYSWWAMHYASLKRFGVSLAIYDGAVGRTFRSFARQILAKRIYGPNAATPGNSNHGLASTVDLMSAAQRRAIDRIGRPYGWAKAWSDASWEWWHLRGLLSRYSKAAAPKATPATAVLTKPERHHSHLLLWHRREYRRRRKGTRDFNKHWSHAAAHRKWLERHAKALTQDLKKHGNTDNRKARLAAIRKVIAATDGTL